MIAAVNPEPGGLRFDLQVIASWIEPGARVLDLGCGNGDLLAPLKSHTQGAGTGIEQAEEKVARCIERERTPVAALGAYESARADRVASLVTKARKRAAIIHGEMPDETREWYAQLAESDGSDILTGLIKTDEGSPL